MGCIAQYNTFMRFWHRRNYLQVQAQALSQAELNKLTESLLNSAYLRQNVLNARFSTTQGFSVIYRQPAPLLEQFPELNAFLNLLTGQANLFYLNVLAISEAGRVDRHIDHSIRGYDAKLPFPELVSVLYVQVPPMTGGELLIYDRQDRLNKTIRPETGMLVHFPGDWKHAVSELGQVAVPRISLVCEQYQLSRRQLKLLPEFTVKSMAPFQTFVDQQL